MSIATLQKKSERFRAPLWISGQGEDGFSLVGGLRNVGYVGQTNLAKSVTRTPFRGTEPMGNGGCCGTYKQNRLAGDVANSGSCCTNDPSIIKTTVKNTKGMIQTKYKRKWNPLSEKWECPRLVLNGQYPHYWVQQSTALGGNTSQSTFIANKTRQASGCVVATNDAGEKNCRNCLYRVGGKLYIRKPYAKAPFPLKGGYSEYLAGELMKKECLFQAANAYQDKNAPFPMAMTHEGCDVNYDTIEDAIAAGALPADHIDAQMN
tara:strand:+ start:582 stop:1370 length:789 start_codon:yes stop_codon:yes gene_type:complete